jgi:hypothetical protein
MLVMAIIGAIAAIAAACFTGRQVSIARDTEQRQLRAYVGTFVPKDLLSIDANRYVTLRLRMKNYGLTPANEIEYLAGINLRDYPLSDRTDFSIPQPTTSPSKITLFSGELEEQQIQAVTKFGLSPQNLDDLRFKRQVLLIWGTLKYRDTFGCRHFTNFCIGVAGDVQGVFTNETCDRHTDTDSGDQCNK